MEHREPAQHTGTLDVLVIGAGAAGLAAAALLGRCRRRVAVVGGQECANASSESVHNLPYAEGVTPEGLYSAMEQELDRYDVALHRETVTTIVADDDAGRFDVHTESRLISASRLVLATGLNYDVPSWVPDDAWGTAVFTCPFCHAYEHEGEPFVVVGKGTATVEMALLCAVHANPLTAIVADEDAASGAAANRVRELGGKVVHDSIHSAARNTTGGLDMVTTTGAKYHAGAVLLVGAMRLRTDLTSQLRLRTGEHGIPESDTEGRSSHPRVWLAGTAAQPHFMLAESIGSGVRVGVSIHKDLCHAGCVVSA